MGGIRQAYYRQVLRLKAISILRSSQTKTPRELLYKLGYHKESSIRSYTRAQVIKIIKDILDMDFNQAIRTYVVYAFPLNSNL